MLWVSLSEKSKVVSVCMCVCEGVVKRELSQTCFPPIAGKPSFQHQVHVELRYAALAFGPLAAKPISPSWRWLNRGWYTQRHMFASMSTQTETHAYTFTLTCSNAGASQTVCKWCARPGASHRGEIYHILQINHIFRKGLPGNMKHSQRIRSIKAG